MCDFCENVNKRVKDTMLVKKNGFHISTHIPSVWVKDIYYCPYCGKELSRSCKTCKYHDSFSWVCFCGSSQFVADFTDNDSVCNEWELNEEFIYSETDEGTTTVP